MNLRFGLRNEFEASASVTEAFDNKLKKYLQSLSQMTDQELTHQIIGAAIEVHKLLGGPGLIESVYESALCHELSLRNLTSQRQMPVPVLYKGFPVRAPLFLDILVENKVVVEVKAIGKENPYYQAQLETYLRLTGLKTGLLIDFGKKLLKDGISKIAQ